MKKKIVTIMLCFALSASCAMPVIASEASEVTTTEAVKEGKKTSKKKMKKKLKKKYALKFHKEVPNDTTGNWRWAEYESDTGFEQFSVDYYNAFVKDNSEVHIIINRKTNITYRLNCYGHLYIMAMEYVPGEENDAVSMCTGYPLAQFEVDPETGTIESVDVSELQADYQAPASTAASSDSVVAAFADVARPIIAESYGDDCDVSADETINTVYIKCWKPGIAAASLYAKLGNAECIASAKVLKDGIATASKTYYDLLKEYDPTAHLVYAVMDDTNLDNTVLMFYDGICVYDFINE